MLSGEWTSPASLGVGALGSFIAAAVVTRLSVAVARRFALHAVPNDRSSHDVPTPQLGGIGASVVPLALLLALVWIPGAGEPSYYGFLFLGGLVFFAVGLWDDIRGLSPKLKLLGQFVGAGIGFAAMTPMLPEGTLNRVLLFGLWMFWVAGFVNAFNFMDGMNGKSGVFTVTALAFIVAMVKLDPPEAGVLSGLLGNQAALPAEVCTGLAAVAVGSVCGFLVFNCRTTAVVFLGDCGSHFLGYLIAMLAFMTSASLAGQGRSMLAFCILLMPFLFDVTLTLVRRTLAGKNIWEAHREHLYQRLMICGMGHMKVLWICAVTYLACGGLAIACIVAETAWGRAACLALSLAVMAAYTGYVRHNEGRRDRREAATG